MIYSMPYQIKGVYEDSFLGKEMCITLHADTSTVVSLQLYKVFDIENQCDVYLNDEFVGTYQIVNELTDIFVPITTNEINNIHIVFETEVVPKELGISEDGRGLTVILVDGKINY